MWWTGLVCHCSLLDLLFIIHCWRTIPFLIMAFGLRRGSSIAKLFRRNLRLGFGARLFFESPVSWGPLEGSGVILRSKIAPSSAWGYRDNWISIALGAGRVRATGSALRWPLERYPGQPGPAGECAKRFREPRTRGWCFQGRENLPLLLTIIFISYLRNNRNIFCSVLVL